MATKGDVEGALSPAEVAAHTEAAVAVFTAQQRLVELEEAVAAARRAEAERPQKLEADLRELDALERRFAALAARRRQLRMQTAEIFEAAEEAAHDDATRRLRVAASVVAAAGGGDEAFRRNTLSSRSADLHASSSSPLSPTPPNDFCEACAKQRVPLLVELESRRRAAVIERAARIEADNTTAAAAALHGAWATTQKARISTTTAASKSTSGAPSPTSFASSPLSSGSASPPGIPPPLQRRLIALVAQDAATGQPVGVYPLCTSSNHNDVVPAAASSATRHLSATGANVTTTTTVGFTAPTPTQSLHFATTAGGGVGTVSGPSGSSRLNLSVSGAPWSPSRSGVSHVPSMSVGGAKVAVGAALPTPPPPSAHFANIEVLPYARHNSVTPPVLGAGAGGHVAAGLMTSSLGTSRDGAARTGVEWRLGGAVPGHRWRITVAPA
jgi:hypothetical protein